MKEEDDGRTIVYFQDKNKCATRTICFECNNRCISCITDFEEHKKNPAFSTEYVKKLIDNIGDDVTTIDYNGGEPTLRRDIIKLLKYTNKKYPNALLQLLTNARMFSNEKFISKFLKADIRNINFFVGLYGHDSKTHDAVARTPGSFEQTIKGIKNLLRYRFNVEVRIIINKFNYKYMEEVAQLIKNEFSGLMRVVFINMKYTGEAYKNRKVIFVDYEDTVPYITKAVDVLKDIMNVKVYHTPLCILPKNYWEYAKGITIPEDQIFVTEECMQCKEKKNCSGIWESYSRFADLSKFKSIK